MHASIPLAARTIEALGQKTGAWTTVITYNAADINAENLQQYDAIFLASTTGLFLDDPADPVSDDGPSQCAAGFRARRQRSGRDSRRDRLVSRRRRRQPVRPPSRAVDGGSPLWPAFNTLIGGFFKFHWIYPTQIAVKIDDPDNPINAPFTSLHQPSGVRLPRPFPSSTRSTPSTRIPGRAPTRTC